MRSCRKIAPLSLLLLLAFAIGRAEVQVGDNFPPLAAAGLSGGEVPAIAGKVVIVDFWASWCAPCRASFTFFSRLHDDYAAKGLVIIAVSVDEKSAAYDSFLKKINPPFATWRDSAQKLVSTVKVPAMPTSYLLDRSGRVRFIHRGFQGKATKSEIEQQVAILLAE